MKKVKTKEELKKAYKKASRPERLVIIGRAGFTTEKEYMAYLDTLVPPVAAATEEENAALDMVITFDTTGSMGSFLSAVRTHVKTLIPKLFEENKDLRLKIVTFGDYCDMAGPNKFGNAYKTIELTTDQNALINFVNQNHSTSGGDQDEFYELVIKKVNEETGWRLNAKKAVLLIADYGPHPVGYSYGSVVYNNQIDWRIEAQKAASMGIQWDTLTCIEAKTAEFYRPLSQITNGVCIPFKTSSKTQEVMYAATAVRGGTKAKAAFAESYKAAVRSGDKELIGSYKSLSELLDK